MSPKRRSPIRHQVSSHIRQGKQIQSFERGKGQKPQRLRRVVRRVSGTNRKKLADHPEPYRRCYERAYVEKRYLYHATPVGNLTKIRKEGLSGPAYFATDPQIALDIVNILRPEAGVGKLIVFKVDIRDNPLYKDLYWEVIRPEPESYETPLKEVTQGKMFYSLSDIPADKVGEVVTR